MVVLMVLCVVKNSIESKKEERTSRTRKKGKQN